MHPPLPAGAYWVTKGLAAGRFPTSIVHGLTAAGLRAFVDLSGDGDRYAPLLPDGSTLTSIPVVDFSVPTRPQMSEILDVIDSHTDAGVYVHCHAGIGRTGTVIGCWLIRHGIATSDTWQTVLDDLRGPGAPRSPETAEQRAFVSAWKADL